MKWAALIAGLFAGTAGAMGLGGGAVLIIHLALFTDTPQLESQGINLLFFIPIALAAVTVYAIKKNIRWRLVLKTAVWGLVGSAAGLCVAVSVPALPQPARPSESKIPVNKTLNLFILLLLIHQGCFHLLCSHFPMCRLHSAPCADLIL